MEGLPTKDKTKCYTKLYVAACGINWLLTEDLDSDHEICPITSHQTLSHAKGVGGVCGRDYHNVRHTNQMLTCVGRKGVNDHT